MYKCHGHRFCDPRSAAEAATLVAAAIATTVAQELNQEHNCFQTSNSLP
jgi:hypothetical protein